MFHQVDQHYYCSFLFVMPYKSDISLMPFIIQNLCKSYMSLILSAHDFLDVGPDANRCEGDWVTELPKNCHRSLI